MSSGDFFDKCREDAEKFLEHCAKTTRENLSGPHADATELANKYAEIARKASTTHTEIRRENGRAYAVEVDKLTGLTAEEARQGAETNRFLAKGGIITYTRTGDEYRVSVQHYSRSQRTTIHGIGTGKLQHKATEAAVFEFFVHRANIARRFKEQCGEAYVDEFTETSNG